MWHLASKNLVWHNGTGSWPCLFAFLSTLNIEFGGMALSTKITRVLSSSYDNTIWKRAICAGRQHLTYNWALPAEATLLVMTDDVAERAARFFSKLHYELEGGREKKPALCDWVTLIGVQKSWNHTWWAENLVEPGYLLLGSHENFQWLPRVIW